MCSKEYFDQVARKWDEMRESLFTEKVREKALSKAGVEKGKTAADIGAGTGFITKGLFQRGSFQSNPASFSPLLSTQALSHR